MTAAGVSAAAIGGVLIASPSALLRDQVRRKLERHQLVHTASGGAEALAALESGRWQMLFLDRCLPDLDAGELVGIIQRRFPGIRVVMVDSEAISSDASVATNIVEFGCKGQKVEVGEATQPIERAVPSQDSPLPGMIGESDPMRAVYRMARLVAGRDTTVLITGETGTGKDLVARAIHQLSARSGASFSVLNCAAIPETLIESELFGYTRGAFTGAAQTYAGRILAAQGGTLFLDEIGELPLASQSKLLRFLEHKEIQRLGSAEVTKSDVRVIAATNRNLPKAVREGTFRGDLFFRLSAFPIRLGALAERGPDILKLARYFLARLGPKGQPLGLDAGSAEKLQTYAWPGNVREMQQVLERAAILAGNASTVLPEHVTFSAMEECA